MARGDALLLVDVQRDFCPGGALPVPEGDRTVQRLNEWIERAAGRVWHPPGHVSFSDRDGPWPPHCVQDTAGAAFHPDLALPRNVLVVSKGQDPERDAYSAFDGTGLAGTLREHGVRRLFVGGLAQDICVRATVLDALGHGFETYLLVDATAPVDEQDGRRALREMEARGAVLVEPASGDASSEAQPAARTAQRVSALFTDLYEVTMAQAYATEGMTGTAVFETFFRRLPPNRPYVIAAGLAAVLDFIETFHFDDEDVEYLRSLGGFRDEFLDMLRTLRFSGDVWAVPEGTLMFPNEPIVQVVGPILEAQLLETFVLNQIHLQSVLATKASRVFDAARGCTVVEFGSRRAHGTDAALEAARASYLAGAAGTSNLLAGRVYGIPAYGTMAHSFIQAYEDELAAFEAFAKLYRGTTLLVDTYDTLQGVDRVIQLARQRGERFTVGAIRLDSGDLAELARGARAKLDAAGLGGIRIFASSGLDEYQIANLLDCDSPIDAFGVGTEMPISADAPALDIAYKLVEYEGVGRTKLSRAKTIYPGRKQVFRESRDGTCVGDVIATAEERCPGDPLLVPVMRGGRRVERAPTLDESRRHARAQLNALAPSPRPLRVRESTYPERVSDEVVRAFERLRGAR